MNKIRIKSIISCICDRLYYIANINRNNYKEY